MTNLTSTKAPFSPGRMLAGAIAVVAIVGVAGNSHKANVNTASTATVADKYDPNSLDRFPVEDAGIAMITVYSEYCDSIPNHLKIAVGVNFRMKGETTMRPVIKAVNEQRQQLGNELYCMMMKPIIQETATSVANILRR